MADDVENHTLRLLQEMRTEMRDGFARVDQRLTAVEQRLTGVEQHLDGIEQRLSGVEQRLGGVEQRLTGSEQRLGGLEGTVSKVIDAVTSMAKVQEQHSAMLAELVETSRISGGRLNTVEARVGRIEKQAGMTLA
jgi:DNA repair ATPase RecN